MLNITCDIKVDMHPNQGDGVRPCARLLVLVVAMDQDYNYYIGFDLQAIGLQGQAIGKGLSYKNMRLRGYAYAYGQGYGLWARATNIGLNYKAIGLYCQGYAYVHTQGQAL